MIIFRAIKIKEHSEKPNAVWYPVPTTHSYLVSCGLYGVGETFYKLGFKSCEYADMGSFDTLVVSLALLYKMNQKV